MDRKRAMVLLKELVSCDLVEPSYVSMMESQPNDFQLQIKCSYNKKELQEFAKKYNLIIEEDKNERYLLIFDK